MHLQSYDMDRFVLQHEEFDDFKTDFLNPPGYCKYYKFSQIKDKYMVPRESVLHIFSSQI